MLTYPFSPSLERRVFISAGKLDNNVGVRTFTEMLRHLLRLGFRIVCKFQSILLILVHTMVAKCFHRRNISVLHRNFPPSCEVVQVQRWSLFISDNFSQRVIFSHYKLLIGLILAGSTDILRVWMMQTFQGRIGTNKCLWLRIRKL